MVLGLTHFDDMRPQYGNRMVWRDDPRSFDVVGIYVGKKGDQQPDRKLTPAQSRLRKRSIFKA